FLQSAEEKWYNARLCRVTASKAHSILTRQKDFEALAARLTTSAKSVDTVAMRYGRDTESTARQLFEELHPGVKAKQVGMLVRESQPWLGCSPDSIVLTDKGIALHEIKCPYKCAKSLIIVDK